MPTPTRPRAARNGGRADLLNPGHAYARLRTNPAPKKAQSFGDGDRTGGSRSIPQRQDPRAVFTAKEKHTGRSEAPVFKKPGPPCPQNGTNILDDREDLKAKKKHSLRMRYKQARFLRKKNLRSRWFLISAVVFGPRSIGRFLPPNPAPVS